MSERLAKLTSISLPIPITMLLTSFIIAISAQISIPLPNGIPITLQTFTVALTAFCLYKNNLGLKSILTYLLLGIIGFPVFAQYKSGIWTVAGITGGFLIGFIFLVYFCQKAKTYGNIFVRLLFLFLGLLSCHLCGILQYCILTKFSVIDATLLISVPFLVKDSISILLAFFISNKMNNNL